MIYGLIFISLWGLSGSLDWVWDMQECIIKEITGNAQQDLSMLQTQANYAEEMYKNRIISQEDEIKALKAVIRLGIDSMHKYDEMNRQYEIDFQDYRSYITELEEDVKRRAAEKG